jgi:hypothetical protein
VTSLEVLRIGTRSGSRAARALELTRARALDALAGRTVWCAGPLPAALPAAQDLRDRVERSRDAGVVAAWLTVSAAAPLRDTAQRLDDALRGAARSGLPPGDAEREVYAQGPWGGEAVRRDDVVVLHDALSAALAHAIRERGAHVVWRVRAGTTPNGQAVWSFLHPYTAAVDAYVLAWGPTGARRLAAIMPAAGVVAEKDVEPGEDDVGWSDVLADIVRGDRAERVGGTRHPRPSVAAR